MADSSSEERSHKASSRRLQKARDSGQVAQSRDVTGAIVLWGGAFMLLVCTPRFVQHWAELLREMIHLFSVIPQGHESLALPIQNAFVATARSLTPFLVGIAALSVFPVLFQTRFLIQGSLLRADWSRLNPQKGIERLLSTKSLWDAAKALIKIAIVVGALFHTLSVLVAHRGEFLSTSPYHFYAQAGAVVWAGFKNIGFWIVVFAMADYVLERRRMNKELMMSRQEVREEYKETEGNPQTKSRLRKLLRRRRGKPLRQAIPQASMIITNPTHVAVAIRYESSMKAPVVVAKGADLRAEKIREIAKEHGIALMENKPLARLLYRTVDVDDEIPSSLYRAVAELLAAVYRLRGRPSDN